MAKPTLPNSFSPHQFLPVLARPFALTSYRKPQREFRVFPTGESEYHWRIVGIPSNRTVSRHKSLNFALKKCTLLNERCKGVRNENN